MTTTSLARRLDLLPLTATGICSMIGASIYVLPFMIQRQVEGIGPYVVIALLLAAVPAFLAALAYAMLSSAMPRAGGSYIFASRGFHPYLGFIASFSQWFGLSIVIGVVAYVTIPFFRDMAIALEWNGLAAVFNTGWVRVGLALALVWYFVWLNVQGLKSYTQAIIPLMLLMFTLGLIVIITGFSNNHETYLASIPDFNPSDFFASNSWKTVLAAASVLFASFIGFDSIAQAGGEAKSPEKLLPRAIGLAVIIVAVYYIVFTAAVYHTVPWEYVAALHNKAI